MTEDKKPGSDKPKEEVKTKPSQIILEKRREVKSSYTRDHKAPDVKKPRDDGKKK